MGTAASNFGDNFKTAAENAYNNTVQPFLDRFNSERQELQQKGALKYAEHKIQQVNSFVKKMLQK